MMVKKIIFSCKTEKIYKKYQELLKWDLSSVYKLIYNVFCLKFNDAELLSLLRDVLKQVSSFLYIYLDMINIFKWVWAHFLPTVKWFHLFLFDTNTHLNIKTVLFQTIQFSKSTKLNGSKYCDVSLTIQLNISHLFTHT